MITLRVEVEYLFLLSMEEIIVFPTNEVNVASTGYFGNILYCGDMRWDPEMLEDPVLRDVVQLRALDTLYLDNTYSAPYCQFPSREEAKQQIFKIIEYDSP